MPVDSPVRFAPRNGKQTCNYFLTSQVVVGGVLGLTRTKHNRLINIVSGRRKKAYQHSKGRGVFYDADAVGEGPKWKDV